MKAVYPAKFIHEDGGEYTVIFPDLDGCITYGENLEHSLSMAQEALGLYLAALEEHNHQVPAASSLDAIETEQGEHIAAITVELNDYRRNKTLKPRASTPLNTESKPRLILT